MTSATRRGIVKASADHVPSRGDEMDRELDKKAGELAEKHVADEIEKAIRQPASIEEAELLDAAELEELEYREDS
jgi:hypothetical protein